MTEKVRSDSDWIISIRTETASLAEIRRFVGQVAAEMEIGPEKSFDLKVAVSEACANAIEHSGTDAVPLEVSAHSSPGRLSFRIQDKGLFRPPSYAREDFGSRGLGLPLMVTLMDEVTFARTPDGGTRVTLSVLLH